MNRDLEKLNEKALALKTIAHPIRLCILRGLIRDGEHNVTKMQSCLDIPQSTLSQHLAKLRLAGLIVDQRRGTEVFYACKDKNVIELINILFEEE